jgi:hypothetical protein
MNKQLIRDLAITGGIYDCICDPYDKLENGDYYSSVMVDLERFAEKIVRECVAQIRPMWNQVKEVGAPPGYDYDTFDLAYNDCMNAIKEHFGVEE